MDASQLNLVVLLALLGFAGILAIIVAAISSRTLRDEGLRRTIKRWLR